MRSSFFSATVSTRSTNFLALLARSSSRAARSASASWGWAGTGVGGIGSAAVNARLGEKNARVRDPGGRRAWRRRSMVERWYSMIWVCMSVAVSCTSVTLALCAAAMADFRANADAARSSLRAVFCEGCGTGCQRRSTHGGRRKCGGIAPARRASAVEHPSPARVIRRIRRIRPKFDRSRGRAGPEGAARVAPSHRESHLGRGPVAGRESARLQPRGDGRRRDAALRADGDLDDDGAGSLRGHGGHVGGWACGALGARVVVWTRPPTTAGV